MKKRTSTAGWIARIFCITAILFVSIFTLDSFDHGTFLEKFASFGMHMIPSVILILILIVAWKHELAGGILFILVGLGMTPSIYNINYNRTHSVTQSLEILSMINLPFVIVGLLFMYSYFKHKKNQHAI